MQRGLREASMVCFLQKYVYIMMNIWKGEVGGRTIAINHYHTSGINYYGWHWDSLDAGMAPYPDAIHEVIKTCRMLNDPRYMAYDPIQFCKEILG